LAAAEGNLVDVNALAFAGQEAVLNGFTKTYGLRGGNDQLPRAFAAALAPRIIYRASACVSTADPTKSSSATGSRAVPSSGSPPTSGSAPSRSRF
jgi:hypothetical protein